jgi:hypothetical protein
MVLLRALSAVALVVASLKSCAEEAALPATFSTAPIRVSRLLPEYTDEKPVKASRGSIFAIGVDSDVASSLEVIEFDSVVRRKLTSRAVCP